MKKLTESTFEYNFETLFSKDIYKIPYFQRPYKWTKSKVENLVNDINKIYDQEESMHFMGAILLYPIPTGEERKMGDSPLHEVIDGQQRLTSVYLTIIALIDLLLDINSDQSNADATRLFKRFIYDQDNETKGNTRLNLSRDDMPQLKYLLEDYLINRNDGVIKNKLNTELIFDIKNWCSTGRVISNFYTIKDSIKKICEYDNINEITKLINITLENLTIVQISISDVSTGPKIYQSLNSNQELTTIGELMKNEIFRSFSPKIDRVKELNTLHDNNWCSFIEDFKINKSDHLDKYFLPFASTINHKVTRDQVFKTFLDSWKNIKSPEEKIDYLKRYKAIYLTLISGETKSNTESRVIFKEKKINKIIKNLSLIGSPITSYPFLFQLLEDHLKEKLEDKNVYEVLSLFESFFVRRNLCGYENTGLNMMFRQLYIRCDNKPNISKISEVIKNSHKNIKLPNDNDVMSAIRFNKMYGAKTTGFILREYDNSLGGDLSDENPETIEHILPQKPNPKDWDSYFTDQQRKEIVDTLANLLPLTKRQNPKLGNRSYDKKRYEYREKSKYTSPSILAKKYDVWNIDNYLIRSKELQNWFIARFPDFFND